MILEEKKKTPHLPPPAPPGGTFSLSWPPLVPNRPHYPQPSKGLLFGGRETNKHRTRERASERAEREGPRPGCSVQCARVCVVRPWRSFFFFLLFFWHCVESIPISVYICVCVCVYMEMCMYKGGKVKDW